MLYLLAHYNMGNCPHPIIISLYTYIITAYSPCSIFSNLQWHGEPLWYVLCHSHCHWSVQDRGSGGCVSGGEDAQATETWSYHYCGKFLCVVLQGYMQYTKGSTFSSSHYSLTQKQYKMIFDSALTFLDSFETYANFQKKWWILQKYFNNDECVFRQFNTAQTFLCVMFI